MLESTGKSPKNGAGQEAENTNNIYGFNKPTPGMHLLNTNELEILRAAKGLHAFQVQLLLELRHVDWCRVQSLVQAATLEFRNQNIFDYLVEESNCQALHTFNKEVSRYVQLENAIGNTMVEEPIETINKNRAAFERNLYYGDELSFDDLG
jgi:hypothetical protein